MAVLLTSDIYHEYTCSYCSEEGDNREADSYCINCARYLCKQCLKYHNRVTGALEHQMVKEDEFPIVSKSLTNVKIQNVPTARCTRHHGKLVDMFCEDHDVVGCSTCMSLEHRTCEHLHYIPDISESRTADQSVQTVKDSLSNIRLEVEELRDSRAETNIRLAREKDACLDTVRKRRKEIDEYLDKLQNVQITDINNNFKELKGKIDQDIELCNKMSTSIQRSYEVLSTSKINPSQVFIDLKHSEKNLFEAQKAIHELNETMNNYLHLKYEIPSEIETILSSEDVFGSLNAGSVYLSDMKFLEDIKIKLNSEKRPCDCHGICQLPDSSLIIADWNNRSIKSLCYDITYRLSDSLKTTNSPWGVCCTDTTEVAVTVPDDLKVEIVSVKPNMMTKSSFKVDCKCHGIAYADKRLYVGHHYDSKLTVYDLQGNLLQTFVADQTGKALFSYLVQLCILPDKERIAVAGGNKGLVMIDMSGELVKEQVYPNRKWTHGVCTDDKDNLIIADYESSQIVTVGVDQDCSTLLVNMDRKPRILYFDNRTKKLFVSFFHCDHLRVFQLKYGP